MEAPLFVISGGDPLQRDDLNELVYHAAALGLHPAITASATPLVTKERIRQLKEVGLAQWAFSLDGSNASIHDRFRGRKGCFDLTMQRIQWLHEAEVPVQINTTLTRHNLSDLPNLYDLVQRLAVVRWEVFTLVPMGRARSSDQLTPQEHEAVMRWLTERVLRTRHLWSRWQSIAHVGWKWLPFHFVVRGSFSKWFLAPFDG